VSRRTDRLDTEGEAVDTTLLTRGFGLLGSSFLIGVGSGIVPLFSVEAYLVALAGRLLRFAALVIVARQVTGVAP
jgi:hypothetical protein